MLVESCKDYKVQSQTLYFMTINFKIYLYVSKQSNPYW
jgi:hypothetical protein